MALTVVTGPPAAGKSTWVMARAKPGDIVIDYDRIAVALTGHGADPHDHPPVLAAVTRAARAAAIETAIRNAATVDVYLIHTEPSAARMAAYAKAGARIVTIDPGRDTVRAQAHGQRPARAYAAIDAWYDKHTMVDPDHDDHGEPQPKRRRRAPNSATPDPRGTQAWKNLRAQVYREETHCWRCGTWVDQTLDRTHPDSRTVDHLDPVATGGPGIPDRTRVRLAHRRCNSRRGSNPAKTLLTVTLRDI